MTNGGIRSMSRISQRREFFVAGEPKAQPRPKAYTRGNRTGVYTPKTADEWKQLVRDGVHSVPRMERYVGAVFEVYLTFYIRRPLYHFETKKAVKGNLKTSAKYHHDTKPDCDNLAKAVLDAITDTQRIWVDDAQVSSLIVSKQYALNEEGCKIRILEIVENEVGDLAQFVRKVEQ